MLLWSIVFLFCIFFLVATFTFYLCCFIVSCLQSQLSSFYSKLFCWGLPRTLCFFGLSYFKSSMASYNFEELSRFPIVFLFSIISVIFKLFSVFFFCYARCFFFAKSKEMQKHHSILQWNTKENMKAILTQTIIKREKWSNLKFKFHIYPHKNMVKENVVRSGF